MAGEASALALHGPFQIRHLFIAALLEAGHHVFKAAAFNTAALPFVIAGTSGAHCRRPGLTGSTGTVVFPALGLLLGSAVVRDLIAGEEEAPC